MRGNGAHTLVSLLLLSELGIYSVFLFCSNMSMTERPEKRDGVENNGFEPLTPCLQSRCSSQLS